MCTIEIIDHTYDVNVKTKEETAKKDNIQNDTCRRRHGAWYYAIIVRDESNFYLRKILSHHTLNFVEYILCKL